ncbi:MAG TPA: hypothetical protein P5330_08580, partial [Candidatus Competibacteraceae bacterium]|nr:hypothetical protein [Candidatus Competibacteraceae bacterium]
GGWSAIAVRSPGDLAELGGDPNQPTATRTAYTNQATILKLEFNAEGALSGQPLPGTYNNAFWLRRGIRESVPRTPDPELDGWPRLLIRSVLDDRQQFIDVGEDFVGDQFQRLTQ